MFRVNFLLMNGNTLPQTHKPAIETPSDFRSGFVAVIGRPNVGKSTMVNSVIGQKVSAVSDKPNTTRNRITGILTREDFQIVFLDTPGIRKKSKGKLQKAMVQTSMNSITESDAPLLVIDAEMPFCREDKFIIENIHSPFILAINKIDLIKKAELLRIISTAAQYGDRIKDIVPVSAIKQDGIKELVGVITKYLSRGEKYFPDDVYTDQSERFLAAEIIREKVFELTRDEIPYRTAVMVETFKENPRKGIIEISAVVFVERKSHKGIIIGKKGELLKKAGSRSRLEIESILGTKVFMNLWVKVKERWSENENLMKEIGYLG